MQKALSQVHWDQEGFIERDGVYNWRKKARVLPPGEWWWKGEGG